MTWMAVAVGAGTAVGGAAGGKKGGSGSNPAADTQARLATQLFGETDPIRQALIGRSANFLGIPSGAGGAAALPETSPSSPYGTPFLGIPPTHSGPMPGSVSITGGARPFDVTASPEYAALMDATNRQFARAKDASIATSPAGGALTESLAGLEGQRAGTLAQGAGQAYGDEISRAMTLGTGQTGTALGGLGSAAQTQAYSANAAATQQAGKSSAIGQGLGAYMGSKA